MADIETFAIADAGGSRFDYRIEAGQLVAAHDLKTAVIISLFTDRRALDDDRLPDESAACRGWWGDAFAARLMGSRLWLLSREKELPEVIARAREYAQEALAWLTEDGIARRMTVSAKDLGAGWLSLDIRIERPGGHLEQFRHDFAWADCGQVRS